MVRTRTSLGTVLCQSVAVFTSFRRHRRRVVPIRADIFAIPPVVHKIL